MSALRSANEKRKTSFRIINRKIVQQLRTYADSTPFILDFYLGKIANSIGFLNVRYYPNTTSRYSAFKYLKLYLNARHLKKSKWHNP